MFFHPLKRSENIHIIEPALVDEIFCQIPELLENHEHFLDNLTTRVDNWSDVQIVGDIFIAEV
jgi:RhoGEF domain.